MGKRVCLTSSGLNSYRTRVLTEGMDIEQYKRNPVLLYQHERGNVIGYVKDIQVEGDTITAELVFDEASETSQRAKKQFEFGSLRMVSVGIDIIETSDEAKYLLEGQTRPTITKSKLFEVSIVDIGANDDAIVMQRDGIRVKFGKDGDCGLPLLINKQAKKMEQKQLALSLGLDENADEATIAAKISELTASKQQADLLAATAQKEAEDQKKVNEALLLAAITAAVDTAIELKKINATKKALFIELGKKVGVDELKNVFAAMSVHTKLSAIIGHQGGTATCSEYAKLSDVPAEEILSLRENDPQTYCRLYKAEYGVECQIETEE